MSLDGGEVAMLLAYEEAEPEHTKRAKAAREAEKHARALEAAVARLRAKEAANGNSG